MTHRVYVENAQSERRVSEKMLTIIRKTVREALDFMQIGFPCEVDIKIVSKEEIRQLNAEFRDTDEPTDVLSFPSGEYDEEIIENLGKNEALFLGDMALCPDKAYVQAAQAKHTPTKEITVLVAHSVLHLLGYDHYDPDEEKEMFALQEQISENVIKRLK